MTTRVLTGITPSGTPHLGNYAGAIRPAIELSRQHDVDAFFFMADYHALIKCEDSERVARSRLEIAATWIAAGLDPQKVTFYRQSDIPETTELCWMLSCVTPKGLMNRAHAYKASVDQNNEKGEEPDDGVTMGLFSYPVLMAADILIFNANKVPVGRDQIQHLEMARDIAQRFNHLYGKGEAFFVLPEVLVDEHVATLPGLDGRKMSKSYDNTIPLFEGGAKALRSAVMKIVTDSREPGVPKDPDSSHVFGLYRAFASAEQTNAFRRSLEEGLGWGEAKTQLLELLESIIGPMREKYNQLMADPAQIEAVLQAGALKARKQSGDLMTRLREAVGLRAPALSSVVNGKKDKAKSKVARFVSFREDGKFHFRLLSAQGDELLLSNAFDSPKEAGLAMGALKQQGPTALGQCQQGMWQLAWEGQVFCLLPDDRMNAVVEAINQLNQQAD
ncbi:MAG TPA: tryptophan--tRNA ligase [Pusillimonas sp.]|jgi:tryptophanyl-tRNA synthetase|nr:tryptophan--tRNA ligase [Pusillimonas sp.]MBC42404.1 tryptophan--tRNA ligase [Pusillimonas sp.]HBT32772.1 tryptophan--tRNA ligase [Pusillimonas sp.]HCP78529.1 tryptophan--tRNA ligase [Pusillimonas sp.]|tara:strand:+ start:38423 stop:39760 length:1338 start_codon:yes stop_codon:yes gene_type:complete